MSYKLNELKQLVREVKREARWEKFLTHTKQSYLLESPSLLKEASTRANKYPFKAIFVFGPAGAGKTFLSGKIGIPRDFEVSNPDTRIEEVFPAFGISMQFVGAKDAKEDPTGEKSSEMNIQQTSRKIMANAVGSHTANLLMIANPLVFDTTGEDPSVMIPKMENLVRLGYDVGIFQINVPTDVSVARDKDRPRTVGEYTYKISKDYQENVVQGGAYLNFALQHKQEPEEQTDPVTGVITSVDKSLVRVFGDAIYPNLYNLETGELLEGITQAHVDEIAPGMTPESAKEMLDRITADLAEWLNPVPHSPQHSEPLNPTGKNILSGMKAMVKMTGGRYGQIMNDLSFSGAVMKEYPEIKDSPEIMAATRTLEELAGEDGTIQKAMWGDVNPETGEWEAGSKQIAKRGIQDVGGQTVRDVAGSDLGNRRKLRNLQWEKDRAAEIEKIKQGVEEYEGLSPEEKRKEINKLYNKKKQKADKYEERLSKETIYKIVKEAIKD